jgi:hypothetical protein
LASGNHLAARLCPTPAGPSAQRPPLARHAQLQCSPVGVHGRRPGGARAAGRRPLGLGRCALQPPPALTCPQCVRPSRRSRMSDMVPACEAACLSTSVGCLRPQIHNMSRPPSSVSHLALGVARLRDAARRRARSMTPAAATGLPRGTRSCEGPSPLTTRHASLDAPPERVRALGGRRALGAATAGVGGLEDEERAMAQGNENTAQPAATGSKTYTLVRVRGVSRHARAMQRRAAPSSLQALVAAAPGTAFPPSYCSVPLR